MVDKSSRAIDPSRRQRMRRLGQALKSIVYWSEQASAYAAKQLRLHPTDLACVGYIFDSGEPLSPKQIISHMGLSSGSGTALLDRLEKAGFVRRVPHPSDRRSVLIELDREKAAEPIAFYQHMRAAYTGVMDRFSDVEIDRIAEFLEAVSEVEMEREVVEMGLQD